MFIVHWTGIGYTDVDHFVSSLRPYRVQFFLDRDAEVYQLFETDHQKPAHALGVNDFAQGVEIETGHYDGTNSPLFSYTPEQIEQTVYLAVEFLRRNGLPVDGTTLLGHYAADLIFTNPYYDPHQARFTRASLRKFDPPQELMDVIVDKASTLDEALDRP
jgi:N-acetyl-anhydromuramyl-L-alanine amidase AmpD